ncbi:hypothetical protein D9M68_909720 [compost metagenome]
MRMSDIHYMYIISHTGTITGVIIITKYGHFGTNADGCLGNNRHQVFRTLVHLPDQGRFMCSYRVEVAQQYDFETGITFYKICTDLLAHLFGRGIRRFGFF